MVCMRLLQVSNTIFMDLFTSFIFVCGINVFLHSDVHYISITTSTDFIFTCIFSLNNFCFGFAIITDLTI